ncbi:MAG: hypothetical protein QNJ72_35320 [Pleurocapsa sp. MO_226.B13]|nr:hypothetical protein [Pleurocapsa sp. MO_226.B13]
MMTDPVTLSAATIATLIATKAFEKTGEQLSEKVWELVANFLKSLKRQAPQTAMAIEKVAAQPALAEQEPENYSPAMLAAKVEEVAEIDPDVKATVELLANAARPEVPMTIENWKGINIKGGINTVSDNTFNF